MAVLASDSFNRANNTTTLGSTDSYNAGTSYAWSTLTTYGINTNQAQKQTGSASLNSGAWINPAVSDYAVTVTFATLGNHPRLAFRATDDNNCIFVLANGTTNYQIVKRQASANSTIGTIAVVPTAGDVIKATCNGSNITVTINGLNSTSVTDAFNQTATKVGFIADDTLARLDNFQVEDLGVSGTAYTGSGTAQGSSSVSAGNAVTLIGSGIVAGSSSVVSSEIESYFATGSAQGKGSASSSETVIAASTTYSGSGTASGTSSASSTETVTFASSGTAQGSASAVGNVAVPTTYTDSGTASGIASVSSADKLISSRGSQLSRTYVFLDAARLNPIQVDANLKVVFDYLNSFVIGIGNIVAATSTSFTVTGLSQTNAQYLVTVIPSWNTTYWITGKTTSGFTINFGTAPASDSTLDWRLMR